MTTMSKTASLTVAGITNVGLAIRVMERIVNRAPTLPGMAAFIGPSGFGKSFAASHVSNRFGAYYVECRSTWTRKDFLFALIEEMGIDPPKTMTQALNLIGEELTLSQRPLIIDEMDYLVDKKAVEVVRDIHEISNSSILLIGEEMMVKKLMRWERFHNRLLETVLAEPASISDAAELCRVYAHHVQIKADLLAALHEECNGNVRRICVNLDNIREHCVSRGITRINRAQWQKPFFTGAAPRRNP